MQKEECLMCEEENIHEDLLEKVRGAMPDECELLEVAELFKVFGDSTRSKIVSALFVSPLCVCDIAEVLQMTTSAVSHQLRILRQANLVKYKKTGKEIIYSLDDEHVYKIFEMAKAHLEE